MQHMELHDVSMSVIKPANYYPADNKYLMNELTWFLDYSSQAQFMQRDLSVKTLTPELIEPVQ